MAPVGFNWEAKGKKGTVIQIGTCSTSNQSWGMLVSFPHHIKQNFEWKSQTSTVKVIFLFFFLDSEKEARITMEKALLY